MSAVTAPVAAIHVDQKNNLEHKAVPSNGAVFLTIRHKIGVIVEWKRKGVIKMKKMSSIDWIAVILVIVGGLNWGLVGFFKFDLVASVFGNMSTLSRIVYDLVGLAALYMVFMKFSMSSEKTD